MNTILNYLLEANAGLILFMLLYLALLDNENQFALKRAYLISAIVISLLFPLFHFNVAGTAQGIPSVAKLVPSNWLPEVVITGDAVSSIQTSNTPSAWKIIEMFYLAVLVLLATLFVYRVISIVRLFIDTPIYKWSDCYVAESEKEQSTFSFFKLIFIGQINKITESEKEEILMHEQVHAHQLHSLDIILINTVGILCWFNPIIHYYRKTLVQLHEFEADARSVANKDVDEYCGLLAKVALQSIDYPIANHFNKSITLKRIEMMKTMKRKIKPWKVAAVVAIIPVFFYLVACQDQVASMKEISQNSSTAIDIPKEVQAQVEKLKKDNPKNTYSILETYEKGQNQIKELSKKGYNMDELAGFELVSSGNRTFVIVAKNEESIKFGEAVKTGDVC